MVFEVSAGIVVFRKTDFEIQFLFLMRKDGQLDFTKGHVERGESKAQAALRETSEEAGIKCILISGFEEKTDYYFFFDNKNIHKELVMFLGEVDRKVKVKTSDEHESYVWLNYEESLQYLKYENQRDIIRKAMDFIKEKVYVN
jgi:DNA polymerase